MIDLAKLDFAEVKAIEGLIDKEINSTFSLIERAKKGNASHLHNHLKKQLEDLMVLKTKFIARRRG